MQTVYSMTEARRQFEALAVRASKGEAFTITRYGKPVAQFVPLTDNGLPIDLKNELEGNVAT